MQKRADRGAQTAIEGVGQLERSALDRVLAGDLDELEGGNAVDSWLAILFNRRSAHDDFRCRRYRRAILLRRLATRYFSCASAAFSSSSDSENALRRFSSALLSRL